MTTEEARTTASEIVQYGDSLRPLIDKMLLMNGISDTNTSGNGILFDAPGTGSGTATQELFNPSGGNAPYVTPPPHACLSTCSYVFSGQYTFTGAGYSGTNAELAMVLAHVPLQVCQMVNVIVGLSGATTTSSPPVYGALTDTPVAFNNTSNYGTLSGDAINISTSSHALCYQEGSGAGPYIYVNAVRAR